VESALVRLEAVKLDLKGPSDRAGREVRSCATCDARCCRVGFNSMLVSRIEARALARRLREPDLAPLVPGIAARARREVEVRGLARDRFAKYDCPLLTAEGRCLVHGPAQPAGCLTFRPVRDGGCDHDVGLFEEHESRIDRLEEEAFGDVADPRPIPVALLDALGEEERMERIRRFLGETVDAERLADAAALEALGARGRWVPDELQPFDEIELALPLDDGRDLLLTAAVEEGRLARIMLMQAAAGDDDADPAALSDEDLTAAMDRQGDRLVRLLEHLTGA